MRLHDLLDYPGRERPDAEFAVHGARRLTYGEALAQANRVANALVEAGLGVGDRAAILSKNSIDYAIGYFGASKAGVVLVPLNYRLAPPEWTFIINDAQARMLLAAPEYVEALERIRPELATVKHCIALGETRTPGWAPYPEWTAPQATRAPDRDIRKEHDVYQMYTSGTTGRPKGAVLTHAAVTSNMVQASMGTKAEAGDRVLIVAPMYHAAAAVTAFCAVYWGGSSTSRPTSFRLTWCGPSARSASRRPPWCPP
jgi:acyl-CoA synthetase (AMP-forming)/AMP-acid ligase II